MKLIFIRGQVPKDRNPNEIKWSSLQESTDLWEHIACRLAGEVEIVYWGENREVEYARNKKVVWVKSLKDYKPPWKPDVIFNRGGFKEAHTVLKRIPGFKIYYGSGKRFLPIEGYNKYDLILVDSPGQLKKAREKFPNIKAELWAKPATSDFKMLSYRRKYDVAYVANGTQASIKGIKWVYKTAPRELKILHLGNKSKYKPPKNIKTRRVLKNKMPVEFNKCKIGILPYDKTDSAPRVLPEMLACNLFVVALDTVNFWHDAYFIDDYRKIRCGIASNKANFWINVMDKLKRMETYMNLEGKYPTYPAQHYLDHLSMSNCIKKLRECLVLE